MWSPFPCQYVELADAIDHTRHQDRRSPATLAWENVPSVLNGENACFLWQVVKMASIPQKYFLSVRACSGVLVRAARRGKKVPAPLDRVKAASGHITAADDTPTVSDDTEGTATLRTLTLSARHIAYGTKPEPC